MRKNRIPEKEFLETILPEILTLMNNIGGFAQLCLQCEITEADRDLFKQVVMANHHLKNLMINTSLAVTSQVVEKKKVVLIFSTLEENIISLWQELTEINNLKIALTIEPNRISQMLIEKDYFLSILLTFVENGLKFGKTSVKITFHHSNETLQVDVTDDGQGIQSRAKKFIFQRVNSRDGNFITHSRVQLYLAAIMAKELNWELSFKSSGPGEGSTFTIKMKMKKKDLLTT